MPWTARRRRGCRGMTSPCQLQAARPGMSPDTSFSDGTLSRYEDGRCRQWDEINELTAARFILFFADRKSQNGSQLSFPHPQVLPSAFRASALFQLRKSHQTNWMSGMDVSADWCHRRNGSWLIWFFCHGRCCGAPPRGVLERAPPKTVSTRRISTRSRTPNTTST